MYRDYLLPMSPVHTSVPLQECNIDLFSVPLQIIILICRPDRGVGQEIALTA
jgi:hypothetical protein